MRQTSRFAERELKAMKGIKGAVSSRVKATIEASRRRERDSVRNAGIGEHAREDGSQSEKGATRVQLFPYVSSRGEERRGGERGRVVGRRV